MNDNPVRRKLTAILLADVKGYSRLMGEGEEGTVNTLTVYRKAMTQYLEPHYGRVVNIAGDALLADFGSVVDAVRYAVEIQRELAARNAGLPADRRMEFRVGVNLAHLLHHGN